mgnify:CR=1 FL=1
MPVPDTKEKSSSFLSVYFYGVLMALFGGLLGFIYLATFPAEAFSSVEEYEKSIAELEEPIYAKPGDSYYIEGTTVRTRAWEDKRQQLSDGVAQTFSLSAGEINGWMAAKFRVAGMTSYGNVCYVAHHGPHFRHSV